MTDSNSHPTPETPTLKPPSSPETLPLNTRPQSRQSQSSIESSSSPQSKTTHPAPLHGSGDQSHLSHEPITPESTHSPPTPQKQRRRHQRLKKSDRIPLPISALTESPARPHILHTPHPSPAGRSHSTPPPPLYLEPEHQSKLQHSTTLTSLPTPAPHNHSALRSHYSDTRIPPPLTHPPLNLALQPSPQRPSSTQSPEIPHNRPLLSTSNRPSRGSAVGTPASADTGSPTHAYRVRTPTHSTRLSRDSRTHREHPSHGTPLPRIHIPPPTYRTPYSQPISPPSRRRKLPLSSHSTTSHNPVPHRPPPPRKLQVPPPLNALRSPLPTLPHTSLLHNARLPAEPTSTYTPHNFATTPSPQKQTSSHHPPDTQPMVTNTTQLHTPPLYPSKPLSSPPPPRSPHTPPGSPSSPPVIRFPALPQKAGKGVQRLPLPSAIQILFKHRIHPSTSLLNPDSPLTIHTPPPPKLSLSRIAFRPSSRPLKPPRSSLPTPHKPTDPPLPKPTPQGRPTPQPPALPLLQLPSRHPHPLLLTISRTDSLLPDVYLPPRSHPRFSTQPPPPPSQQPPTETIPCRKTCPIEGNPPTPNIRSALTLRSSNNRELHIPALSPLPPPPIYSPSKLISIHPLELPQTLECSPKHKSSHNRDKRMSPGDCLYIGHVGINLSSIVTVKYPKTQEETVMDASRCYLPALTLSNDTTRMLAHTTEHNRYNYYDDTAPINQGTNKLKQKMIKKKSFLDPREHLKMAGFKFTTTIQRPVIKCAPNRPACASSPPLYLPNHPGPGSSDNSHRRGTHRVPHVHTEGRLNPFTRPNAPPALGL
ncbi:extensin-like [Penaeus chinensis]|uniref:extensin-like n=1 Tax=Penaeus chinensis TaxID=139456 RepID=UPI001FB69ED2|nr:extensin-like [Penaeus chinensis]